MRLRRILPLALAAIVCLFSSTICSAGILAYHHFTLLSNSLPFSSNTLEIPFSESIKMPSVGCPCRMRVDYSIFVSSTADGIFLEAWASDNTNLFAASENTSGFFNTTGISGSAFSPVTYLNNETLSFVGIGVEGATGSCLSCTMEIEAENTFNTEHSWLDITIMN
jgi:hypothetical protein